MDHLNHMKTLHVPWDTTVQWALRMHFNIIAHWGHSVMSLVFAIQVNVNHALEAITVAKLD